MLQRKVESERQFGEAISWVPQVPRFRVLHISRAALLLEVIFGVLRRTGGFEHVADIMVNSFYDPELEQGCAFEELISFHGGVGGPQTQPFILSPAELPMPPRPVVGAVAVHDLLLGWRRSLQN